LPALTAGLRAALRRLRPSGCAPFGTIAAGQNASPLPPEPDGSEGVCPGGAAQAAAVRLRSVRDHCGGAERLAAAS